MAGQWVEPIPMMSPMSSLLVMRGHADLVNALAEAGDAWHAIPTFLALEQSVFGCDVRVLSFRC